MVPTAPGRPPPDGRLRRLYVELAEGGDLWFDRLGHVARVDGDEGFEAGLVELVFCLGFPDEWPVTPRGAPFSICYTFKKSA